MRGLLDTIARSPLPFGFDMLLEGKWTQALVANSGGPSVDRKPSLRGNRKVYYEPGKTSHNLPHSPFKSCVVPRPIGWISTTDPNGVDNLAPFSQFQNISFDPPIVMFAAGLHLDGRRKDTVANTQSGGEFVWNMATYDLREAVNISGEEVAPGIDEFELAGLTKMLSRRVRPPRIAESPVQFECVYLNTLHFPGATVISTIDVVFGRVVAIHIDDRALTADGLIDVARVRPLARLGYQDYTYVDHVFSMPPIGTKETVGARFAAIEGSAEGVSEELARLRERARAV